MTDQRSQLDAVTACVDAIVANFHGPLLRELARLHVALRQARWFFPDDDVEAYEALIEAYVAYRTEIEAHIFKEEEEVFPRLRAEGRAPAASIFVMKLEHEEEERRLAELLQLAEVCEVPERKAEPWARVKGRLGELIDFQRRHARHEDEVLGPLVLGG